MKVTLKPLSHPAMGDIVISDALFAIGRQEPPFASQPPGTAAKLSKRHARIFQENDKVYIADLGSLNGTTVNNEPLGHDAVALKPNDLVVFGGEFKYQAQMAAETSASLDAAPPIRLLLLPVNSGGEIEPVVIEQFPFLIARIDSVFAHYQDRFPEDLRKISRRHAVITRRGDDIYIEDLDSSNGTFIGGVRLDERACMLNNDDTLAFGGERFTYRVVIERLAPALDQSQIAMTLLKPIEAQLTGSNKTRFVSQANSFLDVFCAEQPPAAAATGEDVGATAAVKVLQPPSGAWGKLRATVAQMWAASVGKSGMDRRVLASVVAVLALIAVAATTSWMLGGGKREIKSLLDTGEHQRSAAVANEYLAKKPNDYEAEAWGEAALAKAVVPRWIALIESRQFAAAQNFVDAQKASHRFIKRGLDMLDMLNWAGRVEAHIVARGGPNAPIVMFRDEATIKSLLDAWDLDSFRHQQLLGQIAAYESAFEPIHARVFSSLRGLRNDHDISIKAINQLNSDVTRKLAENDRSGLNALVTEFESNYPRVKGIELLKTDLVKLDTLTGYIDKRQLADVVSMQRTVQFDTPLLARHVKQLLATVLPSPEATAGYAKAADAWSRGERDRAIESLAVLTSGAWAEVANRQIERYRKVSSDYDALLAARGTKDYGDRLVDFSATLIPTEDQFLVTAIQPDLLEHKGVLLTQLDSAHRRVQSQWDAYRSGGGIPGVIRVEDRISERFKSQAQRLSASYAEIARSNRTYQLLQISPSSEWLALTAEVTGEARRQRRWLKDLNIILSPSLLQAKLSLLPDIPESTT